jgi:excisionase family DNA binding protein
MKPTDDLPNCLLSLPANQDQNCERPVKGQARSRGSLRSPLTEPSQFPSNPPLGKRKKKIESSTTRAVGPDSAKPNPLPTPTPLNPEHSTWLTAAEAAQYLNFKIRTILLWVRQGRLKAYALTGTQRRIWRFLHADLDAIVTQKKPVVSSAQPSVLANERRL